MLPDQQASEMMRNDPADRIVPWAVTVRTIVLSAAAAILVYTVCLLLKVSTVERPWVLIPWSSAFVSIRYLAGTARSGTLARRWLPASISAGVVATVSIFAINIIVPQTDVSGRLTAGFCCIAAAILGVITFTIVNRWNVP
jgi:hypothetical protein